MIAMTVSGKAIQHVSSLMAELGFLAVSPAIFLVMKIEIHHILTTSIISHSKAKLNHYHNFKASNKICAKNLTIGQNKTFLSGNTVP